MSTMNSSERRDQSSVADLIFESASILIQFIYGKDDWRIAALDVAKTVWMSGSVVEVEPTITASTSDDVIAGLSTTIITTPSDDDVIDGAARMERTKAFVDEVMTSPFQVEHEDDEEEEEVEVSRTFMDDDDNNIEKIGKLLCGHIDHQTALSTNGGITINDNRA